MDHLCAIGEELEPEERVDENEDEPNQLRGGIGERDVVHAATLDVFHAATSTGYVWIGKKRLYGKKRQRPEI